MGVIVLAGNSNRFAQSLVTLYSDSLRRKNQQAIQLADQFLRAVFLELFGDPMTNPKGWEVKPLGVCRSFSHPISIALE
jgi:hypothetical protein